MVHGQVPDILMTAGRLTLKDLEYSLPPELIAQEPLPERSSSRLLTVNVTERSLRDSIFHRLPELLRPGDLLVLNDTKVFRARLTGRRAATGGKVEVFLLKDLGDDRWRAMVRPGKAAREGLSFQFGQDLSCTVVRRLGQGRALLRFDSAGDTREILQQIARVPLPPYIKRDPDDMDRKRYQTVFARNTGAVAAPTAGLHFTPGLLEAMKAVSIDHCFITLHVGPGTFQPLRHDILEDNSLETEEYTVSAESLARMRRTVKEGGRLVAVGTTTTRVLETIDMDSKSAISGETGIFIFPPYDFRNVDALITNFHLPGSSLLCLVAAFMGYDLMMEAYRHAIEKSYRFYSYGDAMLIEKEPAE